MHASLQPYQAPRCWGPVVDLTAFSLVNSVPKYIWTLSYNRNYIGTYLLSCGPLYVHVVLCFPSSVGRCEPSGLFRGLRMMTNTHMYTSKEGFLVLGMQ